MRFGPLLVAVTGVVLNALEVLRPHESGPSVFWIAVGALAIVLGIVGHVQARSWEGRGVAAQIAQVPYARPTA
jgi:hypothetical protein